MKSIKILLILLVVTILVLLSFKGNTQTLSDSTKIPNVHLNKVLKAAKAGNEYKKLSENLREQVRNKDNEVNLLEKRLYVKDTTVRYLNQRVDLYQDSYERMQGNYNLERSKHIDTKNAFDNYRSNSEKQIKSLNRQKKANKVVYGVGGTILGTALGILIKTIFIK